ncbi:hypothetical protein TWF281_010200 [Arthrobotrys megalospora]
MGGTSKRVPPGHGATLLGGIPVIWPAHDPTEATTIDTLTNHEALSHRPTSRLERRRSSPFPSWACGVAYIIPENSPPKYLYPVWPTKELIELGTKCNKLSELALSNSYGSGYTSAGSSDNVLRPTWQRTKFPRAAFPNLEVLIISLRKFEVRTNTSEETRTMTLPRITGPELIEMLDGYDSMDNTVLKLRVDSNTKLKVIGVGIGKHGLCPAVGAGRLFWRVNQPPRGAISLSLQPATLQEVLTSYPGWKILGHYPFMVLNEAL